MKKTIFLVLLGTMLSFMTVYAQTGSPVTFKDMIAGKEAVEENCMECHTLEWPMKKIATREEWEHTLTVMASRGAVLSKKNRALVLEYLVAKSAFQTKCSLCHSLDRPLEKNMEFQAWVETVKRMADKKPDNLTEEDIQAIAGFLTAKGAETKLY